MPKQHPRLFTGEMVRAILREEGPKQQTRRLPTPLNSLIDGTGEGIRKHWPRLDWSKAWVDGGPSPAGNAGPYWHVDCPSYHEGAVHRVYPRVQAGDAFWVKETWCTLEDYFPRESSAVIRYRADGLWYNAGGTVMDQCALPDKDPPRWRSSLHMPRSASRILLPIVEVRAERVRDISEADAEAEGVIPFPGGLTKARFIALWDSINGEKQGCSWRDNPPVWIYRWEEVLNAQGAEQCQTAS